QVEVLKNNAVKGAPATKVTTLLPGQIFGEAAMLEDRPRSASVRCITPVQVVVV
ncbi:unnamed protein product, partial [Discosporangium mesarthrocarpum]